MQLYIYIYICNYIMIPPPQGYIVILDEAHNIEKMCEESASLQLTSTDVALCIDEVTAVSRTLQKKC